MKERIRRIFTETTEAPDVLLFANSAEPHLDMGFFYVTGVPSGLFEGSFAAAYPDGSCTILTSPLEETSARAGKDVDVAVAASRDDLRKEFAKLLKGAKKIGLNYREITHESYRGIRRYAKRGKFLDVSVAVGKARSIKDSSEIARISKAAQIAAETAKRIPKMLRSGMTELELAAEVEHSMGTLGASGRSFSTIVAFGAHGAEPHFEPTSTRLKKPTTMVVDFGALYQRYCSDVTRSFAFGRPGKEFRDMHETVEAAQQAAFDKIAAGVPASEVHEAAAKVIDGSRWKGRFIHGLGHSVGLAVHDGFGVSPRVKDALQEGMVVTVEPGIYVPKMGGVRIEDDVLVTKNGYRMLSKAPRGYLEV
jgi:Xaa-Pro dipeptidase